MAKKEIKEGEKPKSNAGRKKAVIDWNIVDDLLMAGCDGTEIAAHLVIAPLTLYRHCEEIYKVNFDVYKQEKKAAGDAILKAIQYQVAIQDKDKTMLVWLGKQRLGQTDKKQTEISGPNGTAIQTETKYDLKNLSIEELELLKKLKSGE